MSQQDRENEMGSAVMAQQHKLKVWLTPEEKLEKAQARVEELENTVQHFIDVTCHYRNLAIVLGAKPEQMVGQFDRELCETGINPDETSGGYHISVNQQLGALKDCWDQLEKVQRLVRDARVLRATNEELTGFRVHIPEEDWDAIVEATNE